MEIGTVKPETTQKRGSRLGRMAFFRVDEALRRRLRAAAKAEERPTSQIVRRAVIEYLDRFEAARSEVPA